MRQGVPRCARVFALAIVAAVALASPPLASAQDCPRTTLADIEDEVMCPICGTPLALATEAPQAQRQRAYIERQVANCRSKDEIKQALVAQFGESVLALPGDEGDDDLGDVLVYVIPALGILLAAGGIAFAVVRWRGAGRGRGGPAPAGAADSSRVDTDMERYDL
jgi:cytochrome c-type biogenesis protein CcmH